MKNISAQFILGMAYYSGTGVKRDISKGAYWLRIAAKNGDIGAKHRLKEFDIPISSGNDLTSHKDWMLQTK